MQLIPDDINFEEYSQHEPEQHAVHPASQWMDDVIDYYHNPQHEFGVQLGWSKTHDDFHFRYGEVSIWAGINGHGKSMLLGQVVLDLMEQGEKVCIASFEMKPKRTMIRMARQAFGYDDPTIPFIKDFGKWTDDKLWLYDHIGHCPAKKVLALVRYAAKMFHVKHFVIDNLTKVIAGEDSYSEQKDFVDALWTIAADLNIHIHLVMHTRKGKDEYELPNKFSLKGSGAVTDQVDNIFIVWRNKEKEKLTREGDNTMVAEPDCILILEKQRNGETEGHYQLWFHTQSFQYTQYRHDSPKKYVYSHR